MVAELRILHVDDEPDTLEFTRELLTMRDKSLAITSVDTPEKALEAVSTGRFDCLLSDYRMPSMSGIELARRVRMVSQIPIVLYTGQGSEEVAEQAFESGVDDYLKKEVHPSHFQVLARRIRQTVEKRRIEELYRTVVENCPDSCVITYGGRILFANRGAARLLGVGDPSELLNRAYLDWVHEEDRGRTSLNVERMLRGEAIPGVTRFKVMRRDGSIRSVVNSNTIICYEGRPACLTFSRDVTE